MHRFLALSLLGLAACQSHGTEHSRPHRDFSFTYATTIPAQGEGKTLDVWLPLPKNDAGVQEILSLDVDAPDGWKKTADRTYGNEMLHVRVPNATQATKVSWTAKVRRYEDTGQGTAAMNSKYLLANERIPVDGKARELAQKTGAQNQTRTVDARAKAIYDDVLHEMVYDKTGKGWGLGDFEHAVTVCKGNCTDFHSRFIGVGRAAGIPVRFTMGIPMKPKAKGSYNSYHCWAHYYDGRAWKPVDISEADKVADSDPAKAEWFFGNLDANRISLTYGRDLILSPAQKGKPLNYFVFPYAEANGESVALGKKDWVFTYENL